VLPVAAWSLTIPQAGWQGISPGRSRALNCNAGLEWA
jgi:hypothetical protein